MSSCSSHCLLAADSTTARSTDPAPPVTEAKVLFDPCIVLYSPNTSARHKMNSVC